MINIVCILRSVKLDVFRELVRIWNFVVSLPEFFNVLCSAVSIETDYGLDDREVGVRVLVGSRKFLLFYIVQTRSVAHPASYPVGTGDSFPGIKRLERDADHSQLVPRSRKRRSSIPPPQ
jgi:hypothetical protein